MEIILGFSRVELRVAIAYIQVFYKYVTVTCCFIC